MRSLRPTLLFAFTLGALAAACGSGSDSDEGGTADFSCTNPGRNRCVEYIGVPLDGPRSDCTEENGTAGRGCSRNGASGVCTETDGQALSRTIYYGLSREEVANARQLCEGTARTWSEA